MSVEPLFTTNGELVKGPLLLIPQTFGDDRGFFYESWNQRRFHADLIAAGTPSAEVDALQFRQDNHSRSNRGVLRGMHFQLPPEPQGKLVRCSLGAIFDVAVDLRLESPSFGQWVSAELTAENHHQLWVPVGFAHGFLTLSDVAEVQYKASGFWNRSCERSLRWDDPTIAITWPLERVSVETPLLAEKDAFAPLLDALKAGGEVF